MPNSEGSGAVDAESAVETAKEGKCIPMVNGNHDVDSKSPVRSNGDTIHINGDVEGTQQPMKSDLSSISFAKKIVRKRHSDSDTLSDNVKKSKLDKCDTPRSEPSPSSSEVPHEPLTILNEIKDEENDEKKLSHDAKSSNGVVKDEESKDDSISSSVELLGEEKPDENDLKCQSLKREGSSESIDVKPIPELEAIIKFESKEETVPPVVQSNTTSTQTTSSADIPVMDKKLLLRNDVLLMYSNNLKNASSNSLMLLKKIAQSKTAQTSNWQTKFYNLHNRFLHLKVSTDKMMETVPKEQKETRSIDSQTDTEDSKESSKTKTAPIASQNGITIVNSQINNRHSANPSPTKSISNTSSGANSTNSNVLPNHVSQPLQQIQNSIAHNAPTTQQHPSSNKIGNQQSDTTSQNQTTQSQAPKTQSSQPVQQAPQQVFLLSARPQASTGQTTQANAAPSSGGSNVIDLTDDDSNANSGNPPRSTGTTAVARTNSRQPSSLHEPNRVRHPMALPRMTATTISHGCCRGLPPPSPQLSVSRTEDGVCLQWNIPNYTSTVYSRIKRYRLFNYSQTPQAVFYSFQNPWKEIGSVDSMDLPMACTLTQIQDNSVYHFAIRPVDEYERLGIWSNTATIEMTALNS